MELGGAGPAAGPGPELGRGGLEALQHTVGSVLASYGWYMLLAAVAVYLLVQKVSRSLAARPSGRRGAAEAAEEPDVVVRRQEALAAARLRMQEELNAQAERYKEKQRQLEEERRRQKIAMWESMQEGKSYKGNLKLSQQEVESGASASTVPKSKPNKKPLRGGEYSLQDGIKDYFKSLTAGALGEQIHSTEFTAITPCLEKEEGRAPGDPAGGARQQVDEANVPSVPWH